MDSLLRMKDEFSRQGILITFNGPFSHSIIEELGTAAKRYMEGRESTTNTITDVFAVYIEQTQNVRNYVRARKLSDHGQDSAIVVIAAQDGAYKISSGNPILKADVPALKERLDELSGLDKDALKKAYKLQLRKPQDPNASGAGLGLIDMARRAASIMEYGFHGLTDDFDFFTLTVRVNGETA
jgi:hypothetical protein